MPPALHFEGSHQVRFLHRLPQLFNQNSNKPKSFRPTRLGLFVPFCSSQDGRAVYGARLKVVYLPELRDFWSPNGGVGSNPTSDMAFDFKLQYPNPFRGSKRDKRLQNGCYLVWLGTFVH